MNIPLEVMQVIEVLQHYKHEAVLTGGCSMNFIQLQIAKKLNLDSRLVIRKLGYYGYM